MSIRHFVLSTTLVSSYDWRSIKSAYTRMQAMLKGAAVFAVFAVFIVLASPALGSPTFNSGFATAHDGSEIYYEVHGSGRRFLLVGFQLQPGSASLQKFVDGLGHDYKIVLAKYPANASDAKMYTLTPSAVARDYLSIASAAGAREFAFYGYSWGAVCGLQLAIRTDRVKALIAGGFPMLNGPYREMNKTMHALVFDGATSLSPPEFDRQILTFYEGLQSFDDRKIQDKLKGIPRLNFVGTRDRVTFAGNVDVDFFGIFDKSKKDLDAAGWDVIAIPDKDHGGALAPEVAVPILREWLTKRWHD